MALSYHPVRECVLRWWSRRAFLAGQGLCDGSWLLATCIYPGRSVSTHTHNEDHLHIHQFNLCRIVMAILGVAVVIICYKRQSNSLLNCIRRDGAAYNLVACRKRVN